MPPSFDLGLDANRAGLVVMYIVIVLAAVGLLLFILSFLVLPRLEGSKWRRWAYSLGIGPQTANLLIVPAVLILDHTLPRGWMELGLESIS